MCATLDVEEVELTTLNEALLGRQPKLCEDLVYLILFFFFLSLLILGSSICLMFFISVFFVSVFIEIKRRVKRNIL